MVADTEAAEGGGKKPLVFPLSLLLCLLNLVQKELTSKAAEIHNLKGAENFIQNPEMSETTLNPKECLAL